MGEDTSRFGQPLATPRINKAATRMNDSNPKAAGSSFFGGCLFSGGGLVFLDAVLIYNIHHDSSGASKEAIMYLPGMLATLALIMVNLVQFEDLQSDAFSNTACSGATRAKLFLFVGFVIGFTSLILSVWTCVHFGERVEDEGSNALGVSIIVQTVAIIASGVLFWIGRQSSQSGIDSSPFL